MNSTTTTGVSVGFHRACTMPAGLEQESACVDHRLLLANQAADPTSVDERELVLPFVTVRDHELSRRGEHSRLRREPSTGVIGRDQLPEDGSGDRWPRCPRTRIEQT